MKKKTLSVRKTIVSGVIAFMVLTLFSFVYYNVPVHSRNNDGATDYVWQSNKRYICMTEGFGYGTTNNEGYMNINDYDDKTDISVLVMGSSHIQGLSIPLNDNCVSILDKKLEGNVYNIAIAGHNFKTCVSNLDNALKKYKPEITVIETSRISFSNKEIDDVVNGNIKEIPSNNEGIIGFLQKNPFLRLVYSQISNLASNNDTEESISDEGNADNGDAGKLLAYISKIAEKYSCKIIIIYHPTVALGDDGELIANTDKQTARFNELCISNGISYIDMSNRYIEEYSDSHIVPTGFNNTSVSKGHLNANGHRMFAEELYTAIMEVK